MTLPQKITKPARSPSVSPLSHPTPSLMATSHPIKPITKCIYTNTRKLLSKASTAMHYLTKLTTFSLHLENPSTLPLEVRSMDTTPSIDGSTVSVLHPDICARGPSPHYPSKQRRRRDSLDDYSDPDFIAERITEIKALIKKSYAICNNPDAFAEALDLYDKIVNKNNKLGAYLVLNDLESAYRSTCISFSKQAKELKQAILSSHTQTQPTSSSNQSIKTNSTSVLANPSHYSGPSTKTLNAEGSHKSDQLMSLQEFQNMVWSSRESDVRPLRVQNRGKAVN